MNLDLFVDPAVVSLSMPPQRPPLTHLKSALEPGSALSKLLDSAMANAAKEETPEVETQPAVATAVPVPVPKPAPALPPGIPQDPALVFVPECKRGRPHVYTIQRLLQLHADPAVLLFDWHRLPPASFWHIKPKSTPETARNSGGLKRNRRSHKCGAPGAGAVLDATRSKPRTAWDRRPGGFLKQTELESYSSDRISELLGENLQEDSPEWDTPVDSAALHIDIGSTVEDFERWKQLRREENRKNGRQVDDAGRFAAAEDSAKGNDVDNFFSYVRTTDDLHSRNSSGSAASGTSAADKGVRLHAKDFSKFSSFFGPVQPLQRPPIDSHGSISEKSDRTATSGSGGATTGGAAARGLRFFKNDAASNTANPPASGHYPGSLPHTPAGLPASNTPHANEAASSSFLHRSSGLPPPVIPVSSPQQGIPGMPRHPPAGVAPAPGLNGLQPLGPRGPISLGAAGQPVGSNENFFFSLLQKRGDEQHQPQSKKEGICSEQLQFVQLGNYGTPAAAPPNHPMFGLPPPGMFPRGMPTPGQHAPHGQHGKLGPMQPNGSTISSGALNANVRMGVPLPSGGIPSHFQNQGETPQQMEMNMQGELPPWIRMHGPNGQSAPPPHYPVGPGYAPQGFPPGLAPSNPPGNQ